MPNSKPPPIVEVASGIRERRGEGEPTSRRVLDATLDTQDMVAAAHATQLTREDVRAATRDGFADALADPQTWNAAWKAIQNHAQIEAGGWIFGGIKRFFARLLSRLFWILVAGAIIYSFGGWHALAGAVKSLFAGDGA